MLIKRSRCIKAVLVAFVLISGLFFCLTGARHSFTPLKSEEQAALYEDKGVYIQARAYTPFESKKYLHQNLLSKGYQPIQISIQNNTPTPWGLGDLSIGMPMVHPKKVARYVLIDSIPRSLGFKVASLFFWPFMIPGTVDTIYTLKTHAKVKRDFIAKGIKEYEEVIPAYSSIHRIIFVAHKHYQDHFYLSLADKETGRIVSYCCEVETNFS